MNDLHPHILASAKRNTLIVAGLGLILAVTLGWTHREALPAAYRFAALACLEPAIGSLIFLLIFRSTGGEWAKPLLPFLSAGIRLLPWCWLALLPLAWLDPIPARILSPDQHALQFYLSHNMYLLRALLYTLLFFLFRWAVAPFLTPTVVAPAPGPSKASSTFSRESAAAIAENRLRFPSAHRRARPWVGPVGLIVLTFSMHLLSTDWLLATDPGWVSTGFPLVWLAGQAIAGLSLAIVIGLFLGLDPARRNPQGSSYGLDWGNLLQASVMFWVYIAFVQLLIIWSGNLPRETSWYLHRWHGLWRAVLVAVVGAHFVLPFFLLLSRAIKRRRGGLSSVALLIFGSQIVYVSWMILPSYHLSGFFEYALVLALLALGGGVFLNRYLANLKVTTSVALS